MNPVGIKCLQDIRNKEYFKDSIIAGGMVRDHVMGGDFTDIDIWVPIQERVTFIDHVANDLTGTIVNMFVTETNPLAGPYIHSNNNVAAVIQGKYLGTIDIDIMGCYHDSRKSFPEQVISRFNYNIDKCFWDDSEIVKDPGCEEDIRYWRATLVNLKSIDGLPRAMKKFFKLQDKYPTIQFNTELLELKKEVEKVNREEKDREFVRRYTQSPSVWTTNDWFGTGTGTNAVLGPGWLDPLPETNT